MRSGLNEAEASREQLLPGMETKHSSGYQN